MVKKRQKGIKSTKEKMERRKRRRREKEIVQEKNLIIPIHMMNTKNSSIETKMRMSGMKKNSQKNQSRKRKLKRTIAWMNLDYLILSSDINDLTMNIIP